MSISRLGRWLPRCMARIGVVLLAAPNIASSQNRQRSCPTIDGGGTIRVHGFDVCRFSKLCHLFSLNSVTLLRAG